MTTEPLGWAELFQDRYTGTDSMLPFLSAAQLLAADAKVVLDVGCGRGGAVDTSQPRPLADLRGPGRTVIGIDVDAAGEENPVLDEFRLIGPDLRWPVDDESVDLAFSDWTLEHVEDPQAFVDELHRVLRPGGAFVARTVSRYSPLSVAARLVPNERHARVLKRMHHDREAHDVFPTAYRMNGEKALGRLLAGRFDWSVAHRTGMTQYVLAWPRLARTVAAVEPRLPKAWQMALVVFARKR
jgi:SAM-dependent methyltransferase